MSHKAPENEEISGREVLDATMEIQIDSIDNVVRALLAENERSGSALRLVPMHYHSIGEITEVDKEIIFNALKKQGIIIGPYILEHLTEIIEVYMEKIGYEPFALRQRIRALQKEKQDKQ